MFNYITQHYFINTICINTKIISMITSRDIFIYFVQLFVVNFFFLNNLINLIDINFDLYKEQW